MSMKCNLKSRLNQTVAAAAVVLLGAGPACATTVAPGGTSPSPSDGAGRQTTVTLAIGEPVRLESGAVVTLRDVTDDSRCPADAECVWAGDAAVTIGVKPSRAATEALVTLHTGRADRRSAATAGLQITLERLDPTPQSGRAIERPQYRASVAISQ